MLARGVRCDEEPAQHAAVRPFELDEAREQRMDRQALDIAGVDACQQRLGEIADRLVAEAAPDELSDRLVVVARFVGGIKLPRAIRNLPRHENSGVDTSGPRRVGMPRNDASGSGTSVPPRRTKAVRGGSVGEQPVAETELAAQSQQPRASAPGANRARRR